MATAMVSGRSTPVLLRGPAEAILAVFGLVLLLMAAVGLTMRAAQAGWLGLDPARFYELMTAHGIGMVGTAGLGGAAVMWLMVARHVRLDARLGWAALALALLGVVAILAAIFGAGFAGAWTFLHPLPVVAGGVWEPHAARLYLFGLLLVGVAFLLIHFEIGRAILGRYGGFARALAWPFLFGRTQEDLPPPTLVAAAAVTIFNTLGIVVGAAVVLALLVTTFDPSFPVDALLAKNMIYFFGHVFINASIYMAVTGLYEIVPQYTGKPWKTSRVLVASWAAILLMVMAVYPHHLLQDTVMPGWALVIGQVLSYLAGLPVLLVTLWALMGQLWRRPLRFDAALALLVTGTVGWAVGTVPAVADAILSVNKVMHNTLWVPGHFHTYLLLGEVALVLGVGSWLVRRDGEAIGASERVALWAYLGGGAVFVLAFLLGGAQGVPRRFAVHEAAWQGLDRLATLAAASALVGLVLLVGRLLGRLARAAEQPA